MGQSPATGQAGQRGARGGERQRRGSVARTWRLSSPSDSLDSESSRWRPRRLRPRPRGEAPLASESESLISDSELSEDSESERSRIACRVEAERAFMDDAAFIVADLPLAW